MPNKPVPINAQQAEAIRQRIIARFPVTGTRGTPRVVRDYPHANETVPWAIVWEDGPNRWAYAVDIGQVAPDGVYIAPITVYAVGVYTVE